MALYTRPFKESERVEIERGLRSSDGVWARRCQILWASAQSQRVCQIAATLNGHEESVRRILRRFNQDGLDGLVSRRRPGRTPLEKSLTDEAMTALLELARQSPQQHGLSRPAWTSDELAQAAFERRLLSLAVSGKRLRRMLERRGYSWKLVKSWLTRPDPDYEKKRGASNG